MFVKEKLIAQKNVTRWFVAAAGSSILLACCMCVCAYESAWFIKSGLSVRHGALVTLILLLGADRLIYQHA